MELFLSHVCELNLVITLHWQNTPAIAFSFFCVPSMGKGIKGYLNIPESESLSQASWWSLLVSRHTSKEARLQTPVLTRADASKII